MPRMVLHRTPVTIRHPETRQWVGMHRGKELADNDPICSDPNLSWLFEDTPEPDVRDSVSLDVEQTTAAPGEQRNTRRR